MPKLPLSKNLKEVMDWTYFSKISMWADNFAKNMPAILGGKDVKELPRFDGEPCICIAAGPSLRRNRHLELLARSNWKHPIIVCDRTLKPCVKKGIIPNIVCSVDGDENIKKFYNSSLLKKYRDKIHAVFSALTVHPEVVKTCPFEKYWFVPVVDQPEDLKSLTAFCHFMTKKTMLIPGGHVGFACFNLALYLGCKVVILIGYDLSYPSLDIRKTIYYKPLLRMAGGDKKRVKKFFKVGKNPLGQKYLIDKVFSAYLEVFCYYLKRVKGAKIVNCTEGGALYPTKAKLKYMPFKEALQKYA